MARQAGEPPVQRDTDLVHHLIVDLQRPNPLGHHRHRFDMTALAADAHTVAGDDAFLLGQHFADLDELLGLGNRVELAVLAPEVKMLGQPVAGGGVRVILGHTERIPHRIKDPRRRVAGGFLVVRVHRVDADGRFERFIVFGERPLVHLVDGEEPRHAFGIHDKRVHPGFRRHIGLVVRHVGAAPGFAVPPHQALFRIPGFALHVGRGTVVENPPVGRPGPGPALMLMHAIRIAVVAAGHLVARLGPAAAENPATGRRTAIVLELTERRQLGIGLDRRASGVGEVGGGGAVDFLGQFFWRRLVGDLVGPGQFEDRVGVFAAFALIALAQAQEQLAHDADVGLRLTRAIGAFPVPLQPAAAVDQRAVFFGEAGGGQAYHFGLDVGALHIVERSDVAPELRGFGGQRVHHHQPLEFGQRRHHPVLVGQRGDRVEALAHVAVDLALPHQVEHLEDVVVGNVQFRQVLVAPVVLGRGVGAVPGFHQADVELAVVLPIGQLPRTQRFLRPFDDVGVVILLGVARQRQVTGQRVGQQPQVGQPLDVGVAAQGIHAPARHADVAQQQLHHGGAADDLRPDGVLGPAQGIENRHGLARLRTRGDFFPYFLHGIDRHAAHLARQVDVVAAVVLLHQLIDATRVLQGRVDLGKTVLTQLVTPAGLVGIGAFGDIVATENPVFEAVAGFDDERHVSVIAHVFVLDFVLGQQVVDQPAHEGDVRAGADRRVIVGHRGGPGKSWVDHDQPRLVVRLGFGHPFETARVRFCRVAAHHQNQIRVSDIGPGIGHGTTAVRRGKTCHRRTVSDTRLVIKPQHAETANDLVGDVARFVGRRRGREETGSQPAVHRLPLGVFFDEVGVAVGLHQVGDAIERVIPGHPRPFAAAGLADLRVLQAAGAVNEVQQARAFGAQGAAVDRVVGVTFDVNDALRDILRRIALAVHDHPTADRAVRAGVAGFMGVGELEVAHLFGKGRRRGHAQRAQARACKADTGDLEELTTAEVHRALLIRWISGSFPGFFWTNTLAAGGLPTLKL